MSKISYDSGDIDIISIGGYVSPAEEKEAEKLIDECFDEPPLKGKYNRKNKKGNKRGFSYLKDSVRNMF